LFILYLKWALQALFHLAVALCFAAAISWFTKITLEHATPTTPHPVSELVTKYILVARRKTKMQVKK
jgi:hypothetical protein